MNAALARSLILSFPHTIETMQWGDNLVFWVGDKAIGGKMFALVSLDADVRAAEPLISFSAGPERFSQLLETEGLVPAPYFARIHWIAATCWSALTVAEWQDHLRHAHDLTHAKLSPRVQASLALPPAQRNRLIADRRPVLKAKEAARQVHAAAPGSGSRTKQA